MLQQRRSVRPIASLNIAPNVTREVWCEPSSPQHSVIVETDVACSLAGRDLGPEAIEIDLVFYDGCHFARGKTSCRLREDESLKVMKIRALKLHA